MLHTSYYRKFFLQEMIFAVNFLKHEQTSKNILSQSDSNLQHDDALLIEGSGEGSSGTAMAFCLTRPGSNPRTDLGFFQFRIAVNLLLLGVQLFLIMFNRMVHTLPSSFLFPIIIYHCKINQSLYNKAYFFFSFSQQLFSIKFP